jgi:hypothetical protein
LQGGGQRTIGGPLVIPFLKTGRAFARPLFMIRAFAGRIINKGRCCCGAGLVCNSQFIEKGKIMKTSEQYKGRAGGPLAGLIILITAARRARRARRHMLTWRAVRRFM